MLVAYVAMDGFDLGAGAVSVFVARNHEERKLVLSAIGPVWDGNEVWLIAVGGALYFAFPVLYASAFSGFYLPLMIVLWLLMLRGMGIELRSHVNDPLWWSFFDFLFFSSSSLLSVFFGAAIGNVMRGVPLQADGYFFEALWTNFRVGPDAGILDWYTTLIGILSLSSLSVHGAIYLAVKTEGQVNIRARRVAARLWPIVVLLAGLGLIATLNIRPSVLENFRLHVWGWGVPILVIVSLVLTRVFLMKRNDLAAFISSTAYLAGMVGGAAFATYPKLLPAITSPEFSLTVDNARSGSYTLHVGLIWWIVGMVLAIAYFVFVYTTFRGKVRSES
jgi:cytochrome d ubiquinol oxidase subunit II